MCPDREKIVLNLHFMYDYILSSAVKAGDSDSTGCGEKLDPALSSLIIMLAPFVFYFLFDRWPVDFFSPRVGVTSLLWQRPRGHRLALEARKYWKAICCYSE